MFGNSSNLVAEPVARWGRRLCRGFTLVELVVVIIVLGVVAVTALPRLTGANAFREAGFHAEVVSALRYAQKTAVSHRRLVCAHVTSASVTLQIAATNPVSTCGTAFLRSPNGDDVFASSTAATLGLSQGVLPVTLFFQPDGRITTGAGSGSTLWSASITVSGMPNITVVGATGYVQ